MFEYIASPSEGDEPVFDPSDREAPWWLDAMAPDESWSSSDALESAVGARVGASQLQGLMEVDVEALTPDQAVTFAQELGRLVAHATGLQLQAQAAVAQRLIADVNADPDRREAPFVTPEMLASAELAAALRVSPRTMDEQLDLAAALAGPMLPLRQALVRGEISPGHVSAIARELNKAPNSVDVSQADEFASLCARILDVVVPFARNHTARQSALRARTLLLATVPTSAAERRREAAEREHGVWLTPTENGSCELVSVMPIAHGQAVFDAITALAGDERFETAAGCITAGQRRVAALATLVLRDPKASLESGQAIAEAKITAKVNVLVPIGSLINGTANAQGGSIGGEHVTAGVILDFLAEASAASTLRRLVTDVDGCVIDAGRTRYAISEAQRHLITMRDQVCRFPGCSRKAETCEIDHATAWEAGGCTDCANLGSLCKHHHQLKTFGGWRITFSDRTGACTWRSPLGRIYEHRAPRLIPDRPEPPPREPLCASVPF